ARDVDAVADPVKPREQPAQTWTERLLVELRYLDASTDDMRQALCRLRTGQLVRRQLDPPVDEVVRSLDDEGSEVGDVDDWNLLQRSLRRECDGELAGLQQRNIPRVEDVLHEVDRRQDGCGQPERLDALLHRELALKYGQTGRLVGAGTGAVDNMR